MSEPRDLALPDGWHRLRPGQWVRVEQRVAVASVWVSGPRWSWSAQGDLQVRYAPTAALAMEAADTYLHRSRST